MVLAAGDFVYAVSFSFLFPCFVFFVKDQIASFQLKQIKLNVFLN